jgi:acyl carrier protein
MDREAVERRVLEIVAEQLGRDVGELSRESRLDELGADSLDVVEMVMEFEDELGIRGRLDIELASMRLRTLGDVIDWIISDEGDGGAGVAAKLRPRPWPPGEGRASFD